MSGLCTICGQEFLTQEKLKQHQGNVHDQTEKSCPTCEKQIVGKKGLNMPLKVHVHHFSEYFELKGETMKFTNGEFVETVHQTLKRHENVHAYTTVRKMGTPKHVERSKNTLTTFNSKRAGFSPASEMTLRKP